MENGENYPSILGGWPGIACFLLDSGADPSVSFEGVPLIHRIAHDIRELDEEDRAGYRKLFEMLILRGADMYAIF